MTAPAPGWQPSPLTVDVDLSHGGRWTSLRTPHREWLWSRPDPAREGVRPGDKFIDVGGVEECFPTVRGEPDHGSAWSQPWQGQAGDALVTVDGATLRRQITESDGSLVIRYQVHANPGFRFVHATHALLRLSTTAYVDARTDQVLVVDDPRPLGADVDWQGRPILADWPNPWNLALQRFGPNDGTATGMILCDCFELAVIDGPDVLITTLEGDAPVTFALWRNLGGYPAAAPYRSTGIEPMVGSSFDRDDVNGAVTVPASGIVSWTLRYVAWRRST